MHLEKMGEIAFCVCVQEPTQDLACLRMHMLPH